MNNLIRNCILICVLFFQGRVFGITVGCLLGMLPLMFIKEKKETSPDDKDKDKKEVETKK